jgi:hypothetical protein
MRCRRLTRSCGRPGCIGRAQAEIYYAYDHIHKNVNSPFRTIHPTTLFNVARFLLMRTLNVRARCLYPVSRLCGSGVK